MSVLILALLSMVCAAVNDFVFKLYARRAGSVGAYLAVIGLVWALVFTIMAVFAGRRFGAPTLGWGLLSGVFSVLSNILFVQALTKQDVGVCATVFRLNLVPAALLAFVLFGEPVTCWRLLAIAVGAIAVVVFSEPFGRKASVGAIAPRIRMVVLAALLRAGMGLAYKAGLLNGAEESGMLALNGYVWVAGGIVFYVAGRRRKVSWRAVWGYGGFSGVLVSGIVFFMLLALRYGDASFVLPITQMSFVLTALLGVIWMKESLTWSKLAGILLGISCIWLMGVKH